MQPSTCFLFASHGHFVGGQANSLDSAANKALNLDANELLDLSPERREELGNYLSSIRFNCPAFCALNAFSYDRATKAAKTELLRHSAHVEDLLRKV